MNGPAKVPATAEFRPWSRGAFSSCPVCPRCGEDHLTDRWHARARPWRAVEFYACSCRVCGQKWKEAGPDAT